MFGSFEDFWDHLCILGSLYWSDVVAFIVSVFIDNLLRAESSSQGIGRGKLVSRMARSGVSDR